MDRRAAVPALIAAALIAGAGEARAQDGYHWPRHHATQPITESVPGALPALPSADENRHGAEHTTGELTDDDLDDGYVYEGTGFEAYVAADGKVRFSDRGPTSSTIGLPVFMMGAGSFDATEMVMRWLGEDPYRAEKARFLDRTFEARARLRMRNDKIVMARALGRLPRYLDRVWTYREWDPALRKKVLFLLWDECAERGNEFLRKSGAQAREIIERYIREQLPPGSRHAFSAAELAALNRARTSEKPFDPYRAAARSVVLRSRQP